MNIKNEKGITLIALVTTIVIMVILATIGISASVGDNGLIKETKGAVIEASIREVEEALETKILLQEKENIKNGTFTNVTIRDLTNIYDETEIDTKTETIDGVNVNYNIYTITPAGLKDLDIEGEYGNTKGVFKIEENDETKEFEVKYEQ